MSGIELASWAAIVFISLLVVVTGFMRRWREVGCDDLVAGIGTENETRAHLNEGVRIYRILAEERGKTIKLLMHQLKELGEDYRKKATELKESKEDFDKLQDLAIWMTGCGYTFMEHDFYLEKRYLMTKGVAEEDSRVDVVVESFTPIDAAELPLRVLKRDLSKTGQGQEEEKG